MKVVLNILFLMIVTSLQGEDIVEYSITSSYWNIETNTLDVILHSETDAIEQLYANYENIHFRFDGQQESDFELTGISKGLVNVSEKKSTIPNAVLIVIDQGIHNSSEKLLVNYRQLAAEIISKHPEGCVFDIAVITNRLSSVRRVSKYTLETILLDLKSSADIDVATDFNRLFKSVDVQKYKKFYLLTNGNSPILNNSMHVYDDIIDRDKLGNTQIIPLSKETSLNETFFTYLDGLNYMSVTRPSFGFVPGGEMPKPLSPYDSQLLLLKYQQTIASPLTNKPYSLTVEYDGQGSDFVGDYIGVLRPFTSAIINTTVGTKTSAIKMSLFYGILFSVFLFALIPFFNRISFKNNHVFQYLDIKEEGVTHSDPLKMSKIKDDDQVVRYGQHIMLLESWKYIKDNMSNPKYAKEYNHFYVDSVDGDLFDQRKGPFKYVLAFWLGSVIATVVSLIYIVFTQNVFSNWQSIELYNMIERQVSGELPLLSNAILVLFILMGSQIVVETIKWSRTKSINIKRNVIICLSLPVISALSLACVYYAHQFEIPHIPYSWILIAIIGLYIKLSYFGSPRQLSVAAFQQYICICLMAYLAYQFISFYVLSSYFADNLVFQIASFIFFSGIGCLFIRYQKEDQHVLGLKVVSPPEIERDIFNLEQHFQNQLKCEFSIGKNPDSDLYIKWLDVDVEMNHAKITKTGEQFEIEPKEGKLYINSNQIFEKTTITGSDEIKFGEASISHFTIINL